MTALLYVPLAEACARLGIAVDTGYRLNARGEFPVPTVRIGNRIKVSVHLLEQFGRGELPAPHLSTIDVSEASA